MWPRVLPILFALAIGSTLTLADGLYCYYRAEPYSLGSDQLDVGAVTRPAWLPVSWPALTRVRQARATTAGYTTRDLFFTLPGYRADDYSAPEYILYTSEFGWPWPVLTRCFNAVGMDSSAHPEVLRTIDLTKVDVEFKGVAGYRMGLALPGWVPVNNQISQHIPIWPHWPGFAAMAASLSLPIWIVIIAPGVLRRARRKRRNQCEACGYPRGSTAVCTECGSALPGGGEKAPA